jgi:hypothetical protein
MSALALLNAEILAGPLRLGAVANELTLDLETEGKDVTVFASAGWHQLVSGRRSSMIETSGFMDASPTETGAPAPDLQMWSELGGAQVPVTISPQGTDLDVAYMVGTRRGSIELFDKIGEVAPFASSMWGDGLIGRGQLIHPATVLRTAGGTGSTAILGTIPTGKFLVTAIHVVAVAGGSPALTVTIQRDDNAGFSSPTTVTTNGPISSPAAFQFIVPGPISPDDRYRVTWTLTGATPTARFGVAVGITP